MDELVDQIRRGDRRSLARAMTLVDGVGSDVTSFKDRLRQSTGNVPWWGFTGPPGVGKSTLIDALVTLLRRSAHRIGIIAIDPTSPVSGGALLGDRVRMMRHAVDRDVFIRSLATRGREGGMSDAAVHCARLLELASYDPVLIETVGVGQNEVDVASVADVCVVVLGPGYGDDIQLIKAGLLEVADVVVINKCDLPEAGRLLKEVHGVLAGIVGVAEARRRPDPHTPAASGSDADGDESASMGVRRVEVLGVEAKSGKGVEELLDTLIEADRAAREPARRQSLHDRRILGEIRRNAMTRFEKSLDHVLSDPKHRVHVDRLLHGECSLDMMAGGFASEAATELYREAPDVWDVPGEDSA